VFVDPKQTNTLGSKNAVNNYDMTSNWQNKSQTLKFYGWSCVNEISWLVIKFTEFMVW
jgi:hypothetical protein